MSDEQKEKMDLFGAVPLDGAAAKQGDTSAEHPGADTAPKEGEPPQEKPVDDQSALEKPASLKSEETVGEILLAARERLGQTLEFMSQETKIPKQMLQYLETDNYEALPAKVYAKSFLRTYAETLALDVQHILNKYEFQTGQTHRSKGDHWEIESEVVEEKLRSSLALKRVIVPAIIGVAAIILLAKFAGKREERVEPPRQVDIKEELLDKKPVQAEEPKKQESAPAGPESALEPMELRIFANPTDSCWFELMSVSVVEQQPETTISLFTLQPGGSRTFQATEEFVFKKVGNAGGFVMELNGSKLPTLGRKGKVITNYRITRDNLPKGKKDQR